MELSAITKSVAQRQAEFALAKANVAEQRVALDQAKVDLSNAEEAQRLAQVAAQRVQEMAHAQISQVVTECLESVFDEPYRFLIDFQKKRGRTEANLIFEREGLEVDPLTASGGGVVDTAALALRLSCLMLSQPPLQKVLVLDEPFKSVSGRNDFQGRVRTMIEKLSKDLHTQIILVTQIPAFEMGEVIEL